MQPLSGILVLDFTTLLPGPLATLLLAEAGAEVIKIERPGGEDMRHYEPRFDGESAMFTLLNRGKTKPGARSQAARPIATSCSRCIERADVLVEQFRPGVMARLGLGYEAVRAINPKLVYCSITGYGQTGPRAGEAGHDLNYIGHTGLLALNPGPPDRPVVPPALVADIAGGTLPAVMNILLGLRQRDQSGQGCHLDIAMTDAMFTFASHALASGQATGTFPGMGGARLTRRLAALSALSDAGRQARLLRGAGAEILGAVHRGDRARRRSSSTTAAIPRRPRPRSPPIIAEQDRRRMAAGVCRGRLLRHHHGDAGGGAARSAFRRARVVRAQGCGADRARPCRRCRCRSIRNSATIRGW